MGKLIAAIVIVSAIGWPATAKAGPPADVARPGVTASAPAQVSPGPLAAAAARELAVIVEEPALRQAQVRERNRIEGRNWIARHPVMFGALVGAGAGALAAATMDNELFCRSDTDHGGDDCVFYGEERVLAGAAIGTGVGAAVGAIVGAVRD